MDLPSTNPSFQLLDHHHIPLELNMPADKTTQLRLPARSISVPSSISPEAQKVLAAAAGMAMHWADYPALDDVAGWRAYRDVANSNMMLMLGDVVQQLPRLQTSIVEVGLAKAHKIDGRNDAAQRVLLSVHGGALIAGAGTVCELFARVQAAATGALVIAPDYRMPPEHPYPAALDDCMTIYREVLASHDAAQVVIHGMSAGGNLAAAMVLRAKDEGLPLPAGLILETPEIDLTESGDTFQTNAIIDNVLQRTLGPINALYANGADLSDPYLSPLFGDMRGFPPTLLTAGTRDMFLSNAVRMHHRLRAAGAEAELLVYEAMPHGGFFGTPEDLLVKQDILRFANRLWNGS